MKFESKYKRFHSWKCIWKCCLPGWDEFKIHQLYMLYSNIVLKQRFKTMKHQRAKSTDKTQITHWGRVTHICVGALTIIGSDNGLSPGRRQAIIWTNAGILLIGSLGTNFSEILIEICTFSFTKMHLKMSSGKWRPSSLGLNVLTQENLCMLGLKPQP